MTKEKEYTPKITRDELWDKIRDKVPELRVFSIGGAYMTYVSRDALIDLAKKLKVKIKKEEL